MRCDPGLQPGAVVSLGLSAAAPSSRYPPFAISGHITGSNLLLSLLRQFESFRTSPIVPELPAHNKVPCLRAEGQGCSF
eukprot:748743-Hanusia_phi.AAC.4